MQTWAMNFNDHLTRRVQTIARASDGEKKTLVINLKISSTFVFYISDGLEGKIMAACIFLPF